MKLSHILAMGIVLGVLVLGLFAKTLQQPPHLARDLFVTLTDFDPAHAQRILIGKGPAEPQAEIHREGDSWVVANLWNAGADTERVQRLLGRLAGLRGEQRSASGGLLEDYGLTESDSFFVRVLGAQEKEWVNLRIGTERPGAHSSFVRKGGSVDVFATDEPILSTLGIFGDPRQAVPDAGYWADLGFFARSLEAIRAFEIARIENGEERRIASLEKTEGDSPAWNFVNSELPFKADAEKVRMFLDTIRDGKAIRIADPHQEYGFGDSGFKVTLNFSDGSDETLYGAKSPQEDRFYLKTSLGDTVYEISSYAAGRLNRSERHFALDNPFGIRAEDVREITLRHKENETFLSRTGDKQEMFDRTVRALSRLEFLASVMEGPTAGLFEGSVPYSTEVRAMGGLKWNLEFEEKIKEKSGHPFRVAGDHRVFILPDQAFVEIFHPFGLKTGDKRR